MEQLLQYVWHHRIFPLQALQTVQGDTLEVLDSGLPHTDAGPDFFNAKIKFNGIVWVGNVEVHLKASDWFRHHHETDAAYDTVILHVVSVSDRVVKRSDGEEIPQLVLPVPADVEQNYRELLAASAFPPCYRIVPSLPKLIVHSWMDTLRIERLEQKYAQLQVRLGRCEGRWEDATFVTLARNFGFGLNTDTFELWASQIPLQAVGRHRDDLFQIEAFFFGQAGLLETEAGDEYYMALRKEYLYLARKFGLTPMDGSLWRFLRTRPQNFPHVRIAQLAYLYQQAQGLLSRLIEVDSLKDAGALLQTGTSAYWRTHYTFESSSLERNNSLSHTAITLLTINTVVPVLFAYGRHIGREDLCSRAAGFLEQLAPENNYIIRMWSQVGLQAQHAGDSQALIQLKKTYCDNRKCLHCRFGYYYLRRKVS